MCTDVKIQYNHNQSSQSISARTMEFAINLETEVWFRAKQDFAFTTLVSPNQSDQIFTKRFDAKRASERSFYTSWQGNFSFVHCNALSRVNTPYGSTDGINEVGLSVGSLYLPIFNQNVKIDHIPENALAMGSALFATFILSSFENVDRMVEYFANNPCYIFDSTVETGNPASPTLSMNQHFVIHDSQQKSAVIEFLNGDMRIYRSYEPSSEPQSQTDIDAQKYQTQKIAFKNYNVLIDHTYAGVMTNCPDYHWHLNHLSYFGNMRNYSPTNEHTTTGKRSVSVPGPLHSVLGGGTWGLPADSTPASRFVQTYVVNQLSEQPTSFDEAFSLGQKLLNRVDIPLGLNRPDDQKPGHGENFTSDITQWSVIRNNSADAPELYLRTYGNMTWQVANVKDYAHLTEDLQLSPVLELLPITIATPFKEAQKCVKIKVA